MKKILSTVLMFLSLVSFSKAKFEDINIEKINKSGTYAVYSALWCPHCLAEFKHLQEIYDKYPDNFYISVFIANDNSKEEILSYMNKMNYTFPIYYDEKNLFADAFRIEYYPTILKVGEKYVKRIDEFVFNVDNYYEMNKENIDKNERAKLENIIVLDKNMNKVKLVDLLTKNTNVVYDINEFDRLAKRYSNNLIYLIDGSSLTIDEFKAYTKHKNVYYVFDNSMFKNANIPLRSVLKVRNGYILNSFKIEK